MFIRTINKAVYDGFVARKRPTTDHFNILWEEVWLLWNQVKEKGWVVVLFKVKGHANAGHVIEGLITERDRFGNHLADHWAGKAAKEHDVPWDRQKRNEVTDATCWTIQARILAIVDEFFKLITKDPKEEGPKEEIVTMLGHWIRN